MTAPADTATTAAGRVRRGAELLDRQIPDWAGRIDTERLDLSDDCLCVLGQLHDGNEFAAPYRVGAYRLGLDGAEEVAHGFTAAQVGSQEQWAELDRLWAAEIRARQGGARQPTPEGGNAVTLAALADDLAGVLDVEAGLAAILGTATEPGTTEPAAGTAPEGTP